MSKSSVILKHWETEITEQLGCMCVKERERECVCVCVCVNGWVGVFVWLSMSVRGGVYVLWKKGE